jgi:leucyl aminopeptidase
MSKKNHAALTSGAGNPRNLHFLNKDQFKNWLKKASAEQVRWAEDHGFTAAKDTRLVLPDKAGRIDAAIIGASGNPYRDGAMAARLPQGVYKIEGEVDIQTGLGFVLDQYRFNKFRKSPSVSLKPQLVIADDALRHRMTAISDGVVLARDLINMPANYMTPQGLEDAGRDLAKKFGAKIKVAKGDALAKNYPAIHTVGRAAEIPPRLIDMIWDNRGSGKGLSVTLVGKGITFDSGGLDLKPSSAMEIMKKDMGGSAHVLGLAHAIMALGLELRLRVLIPAAENAVSSKAMRPLDVIDTAAGVPVEVGNTDAEGRLVLADAFHLATREEPDLMIDFATLTGAARIAAGTELPALFTNDDDLGRAFIAAGEDAGDPLWLMPLHKPYDRYLEDGHVALSSTGSSRYGGAITAALFLQRFLQKPVPWAHVDVMAWNLSARPGHPRGGEAMGLRAALKLIEDKISAAS